MVSNNGFDKNDSKAKKYLTLNYFMFVKLCSIASIEMYTRKHYLIAESNISSKKYEEYVNMSERRLKGGVIIGYLDFVKRQWGQEGVDECINSIDVNDISTLKTETFYSGNLDEEVLKWISRTKGEEFVRKAGNHTVKNLGSLAYLVRFVNIKHLLKKAKENYEETFDFGEISVLCDDFSKKAVVIMKNSNDTEEACIAWEGALEGMMEVTRTKGTVKRTKCQMKGDPYDEFILDWQ